jgi:hypothetical protein
MASSGMLRRVVLVRTEVSDELPSSFIMVTRIVELGTMLLTASVVPSLPILVTLMMESLSSSETSVFTSASRRNIPEDDILHTIQYSYYTTNININMILLHVFSSYNSLINIWYQILIYRDVRGIISPE